MSVLPIQQPETHKEPLDIMNNVTILEQKPGELISKSTIEGIIQEIVSHLNPYKIILFGSYAKGNPTSESDLDLAIIADSDLPRYKRAKAIHLLFRPYPCSMDIVVYTPEEVKKWNGVINHITTEIFRTGQVVYER